MNLPIRQPPSTQESQDSTQIGVHERDRRFLKEDGGEGPLAQAGI